jgi:aspartate kinase
MKVFKFGGASVKDAQSVKNVGEILQHHLSQNLIVVISAMGKTTNELERLTQAFFNNQSNKFELFQEIKSYHLQIAQELFADTNHNLFDQLNDTFVELEWAIEGQPEHVFNHEYDQIVSMGEILSTQIVSAYLNEVGVKNKWVDARGLIATDDTFREAQVDFAATEERVKRELLPFFSGNSILITQGFIGATSENFTTTLGREGSDYTAAILAYCSDAESVSIWKDVPGVLNADPKWFSETSLIPELTYQDAIELTYYGATVIHPKTIKPIQNKNIPLYVRSFIDYLKEGTVIREGQKKLPVPSYIFKKNQILISIQPKDFSFIAEDNLSQIFQLFHKHRLKINVMQLSAINFSVCVDHEESKINSIIKELQSDFKVLYNENLELCTIRYSDSNTVEKVTENKQILLEQKSRYTVQLVMKDKS